MKVIFLDIDGVLNLRRRERDRYGSLFHKQFVDNLDRIIKETDAKIVISSTWRSSGLDVMQKMWRDRKLPGEVIDITGRLSFAKQGYGSAPRGCEIDMWLSDQGFQRINWCDETQIKYLEMSKVKNYIILDDDSDMLYNQREHFVRCSRNHTHKDNIEGYGLTSKLADRAIDILNSSIIDLYYEHHSLLNK